MAPNDRFDDTSIVLSPRSRLAVRDVPPEQNPAVLYLNKLPSKASRRTVRGSLARAAKIFDSIDRGVAPEKSTADAATYPWWAPGAVTYAKVEAAVSLVARERGTNGFKRPAARLMCSALKRVARFAFGLGQISADERMRIDDVEPPKLSGKPKGRRLTDDEIERLYAVCAQDGAPKGRRDAALLAIAIGGGARRFEISALDLSDYARPSRLGRDPVEITVRHGKGDQYDTIVAPPDVAEAIESWLQVRGREPGALFPSSRGRYRELEPGSRLSASGVYDVILRRGAKAKVKPKIAPHDLRRTAITVFLEKTRDLALAKTFARHADPKTTAQYDHREIDALRRAVAKIKTGFDE